PTRPPRGSKGRHRRRGTLPVPRMPATPQPPPGGSADRRRSCWFGGCTASVTGPLRPFLPSCKRVECTAVRLLRQGLPARRAPAGPPPLSGCQRGRSRTWGLRIILSSRKPGKMPPYHAIVRGVCDDSAPIFLPDGCLGTPMALLHVASCLAQPRRGDPTEARRAR